MDEYNREAHDFTEKALKDLKEFCKSPDCNTWKVMSRLRKPDRYLSFLFIPLTPFSHFFNKI